MKYTSTANGSNLILTKIPFKPIGRYLAKKGGGGLNVPRQNRFFSDSGFFPRRKFKNCVDRYQGNYRTRSLTCFDQLLCEKTPLFQLLEKNSYRNQIYSSHIQSKLFDS